MKNLSDKSIELYNLMCRKGYPEDFACIIARELNTDFTARLMCGYISRCPKLPLEEVADEMFAILSHRQRIINKHVLEHAQSKINDFYRNGVENEQD